MSDLSTASPIMSTVDQTPHWTARHGKPILFLILTLVAVGIYLALSIPVAVFPSTNFPRIVVGADVGVYPIDQMLVTVTQPLEEAVNTVPGLDHVTSITSRGSAEIDLFFDWNACRGSAFSSEQGRLCHDVAEPNRYVPNESAGLRAAGYRGVRVDLKTGLGRVGN